MARRSQPLATMNRTRAAFVAVMLAVGTGCGPGLPGGGGGNPREFDSGAETSHDASTVVDPADVQQGAPGEGGLGTDAAVDSGVGASPQFADDFDQVAECIGQASGVRFRTAGAPVRASTNSASNTAGCVEIGPTARETGSRFAPVRSVAMAAAPVAYVDSTVAFGTPADGSEVMPYRSIEDALAHTPRPRTLVLARGDYPIPTSPGGGPLRVDFELTIVGRNPAGSDATRVTGNEGLVAASANGVLVLRDLSLRSVSEGSTAVRVEGGAVFSASNVSINARARALDVADLSSQATLDHARLEGGAAVTVASRLGASVSLRQTRVIPSSGATVMVDRGSFSAVETAIVPDSTIPSTGEGIVFLGAPQRAGVVDRLDRVVIRLAMGVGLRVTGADRRVAASMIEVTGTQPRASDEVAGVYVSNGASLAIDDGLTRVENESTDAIVGQGSLIGGNHGTGVLATGEGTVLRLNGALIERNLGPGVVAQLQASVPQMQLVSAQRNRGAGFAFTTGASLVGIFDDTAFDTQSAPLHFTDGASMSVGVGFLVANARPSTGSHVQIFDDTARGNDTLAALFVGTSISVNRFTVNAGEIAARASDTSAIGNGASTLEIFDDTAFEARSALRRPIGALRTPAAFSPL